MATAVARGPLQLLLQTSTGQYVILGMGVYALFPEKFHKALEYSPSLMKLVGGLTNNDGESRNNHNNSRQPIIIHTPSPTIIGGGYGGGGGGGKTWVGTIVYAAAGAGACWAGYVIAVQLLPDAIGQFLPVTRSVFDKATQSLGKGILSCKKVLEEKIMILTGQQEDLLKKQDDTNKTVSHIKSQLGEARIDLTMLQGSMDRCEGSLEHSEGMQQYTLRGVRLLVRCVANMLPDNQDTSSELARFIEDEQLQQLHLLNGHHPSTPNKSGIVADSSDTIPMASAVTTGTPIFTPSLRRQSSRRASDVSTITKKALSSNLEDANHENEAAFSDIRALLGH